MPLSYWFNRLFGRMMKKTRKAFVSQARKPIRRTRLQLEALEDRLTPSVSTSVASGTLTLTYSGVNNDAVTVKATGTNTFTVTGTGGTTLNSVVNGTSGPFSSITAITVTGSSATGEGVTFDANAQSVSLTGSVTISEIENVTVTDNSNAGTGTLSVGSFSAAQNPLAGVAASISRPLTATSGAITISGFNSVSDTAAITTSGGAVTLGTIGGLLTLDSPIDTTDGGNDTAGANVTLQSDQMSFGASLLVKAGTNRAIVETYTSGRTINLGTDPSSGSLAVSNTDLSKFSAGTMQVGSTSSGNITITANITALSQWNTLTLESGGSITENSGSPGPVVIVNYLHVVAGNAVSMNNGNLISGLAATVTNAGQGFSFENNGSLPITTVDGVSGIVTDGGAVDLVDTVLGSQLTVSQPVDTTDSGASTGANVVFQSDIISVANTVNAGTAVVQLEPYTSARQVDLGTNPDNGKLGVGNSDLAEITAGVTRIGSSSAGNLIITAAIDLGSGALSLISGGTITQTSTSDTLTAPSLALQGTGGVTIAGANVVTNVAGTTSDNAFSFMAVGSPSVGSVDGVNGVFTSGGSILLEDTNTSGTLGVNASVSTGGTSGIMLIANQMNIAAAVISDAAVTTLLPYSAGNTINLGGTGSSTTLGLVTSDLNEISAGTLRIGSLSQADPITVSAPVVASSTTSLLSLLTTAGITSSGGPLTAAELALDANTGIGVTGTPLSLDVGALAAVNNTSGNIVISDASSTGLTISGTTLDGVTGVSAESGGSISLANTTGSLTVSNSVSTTGGGNVALSSSSTLTTSVAVGATGGGDVSLSTTSGNISVGGTVSATGSGTVTLSATGGTLSTAMAVSAVAGNVSLSSSGTLTTSASVSATGGGSVSLSTTSGNISDGGTVSATGSGTVTLSAIGGSLSTMATISAAAGNVSLSSSGGTLTVSAAVSTTSGGNVSLSAAGGALTVGANLTAASTGSVTVATTGQRNISVSASETISATGSGNVNINPGGNLTIDPTAKVTTNGGTINFNLDNGNTGTGTGSTLTLSSVSLQSTAGAVIDGGTQVDTYNITGPSTNTPITINGDGPTTSGDVLNFNLSGITTDVLYLTGVDTGIFAFGSSYDSLTYNGVAGIGSGTGQYNLALLMKQAGFQDGNTAADSAVVNGGATTFTVNAGSDGTTPTPFFSGATSQIRSFTFIGSADPSSVTVQALPSTINATLEGGSGNTTFNFGSAANSLGALSSFVAVYGGSGSNSVTMNDSGNNGSYSYVVVYNYVSTSSSAGIVVYHSIQSLTVKGAIQASSYVVASTGQGLSTSVVGNAGNDSFIVYAAKPGSSSGLGGQISIDGGGGANSMYVNTAAIEQPDAIYVGASTITNGNSQVYISYKATGGTFGGGIQIVGNTGGANQNFTIEGAPSNAPLYIYGETGNNQFTVLVTGSSGYSSLFLIGGSGTNTLSAYDETGGATVYVSPAATTRQMSFDYTSGNIDSSFYFTDFTNIFTSPTAKKS